MTQIASRIQSKATATMRRVESYRKRFGDGHIYLACYAALPLALTPDLLYRLWANYQRDMQGELLEIPWIAVSDLLLSNLCEEVGEELYEMEDGVREVLLKQLRSLPQLGEARLKEVAEFVLAYVEPQLNSPDSDVRDLAEVQQWRSLAYVEPEAAARSIALRLVELDYGDKSEWLRMARLVEPLAEPLVEFEALVDYVGGMAAFVRGQREAAISQLRRTLRDKSEVEVAGVQLPLPEAVRSTVQKESAAVSSQKSWVDFVLANRRWVGAGAGLFVILGSGGYWWRSENATTLPSNPPTTPSASPTTDPVTAGLVVSLDQPLFDIQKTSDKTPPDRPELNQSQAIESIQRFLEAKPSIFAPPFDADLAKSVTTGPLYSDITKKDGSIAWLKARQASYRFSDYKIDRIWGFSNSTPRPSLKLQITENKILYGPKGIIESESGQTQQNMTYFLEFEDNRWKIYDRRVDDNQNEDSLRTKGP